MPRHESGVRCHASEIALIIFLSEMPLSERERGTNYSSPKSAFLSLSAQTEKVNL